MRQASARSVQGAFTDSLRKADASMSRRNATCRDACASAASLSGSPDAQGDLFVPRRRTVCGVVQRWLQACGEERAAALGHDDDGSTTEAETEAEAQAVARAIDGTGGSVRC